MFEHLPRRGFLRQLCHLPLIGGGIGLIGAPSAVAEPITTGLLDAYDRFLAGERDLLGKEMREPGMPMGRIWPDPSDELAILRWAREIVTEHERIKQELAARWAVTETMPVFRLPASTRAALVLSAVGCDWRTL